MSLCKRGNQYWTDFTVEEVRFRKSLGTRKLHEAKQKERELIDAAMRGQLLSGPQRTRRLFDAIDAYLSAKRMRCSRRTLELEEERLAIVKRHFGDVQLSKITATAIAKYQQDRHDANIANRTINMDVGVLSRVLKFCGCWRALADRVRNLPERQRTVGRALTPEEQRRLFDAAASNPEWEHVYCAAVVAANTSMRPVEVKNLRRCSVDLVRKTVAVTRSKNESGHRLIPLNASALTALARMIDRADVLGFDEQEHYLWPACQWGRFDPSRPIEKWDTAWRALRDAANLPGLRFHDLRHTMITELAEMGVADHVMESITGHLSRKMLEHYSHTRLDAKRTALDALDVLRKQQQNDLAGVSNEAASDPDPPTTQSTSQSDWTELGRRAKLLIPFVRRDVRVVEGARLESVCRGNPTEGSNPSLSAI